MWTSPSFRAIEGEAMKTNCALFFATTFVTLLFAPGSLETAAAQSGGAIEGIVTRTGTTEGIQGIKVTLSGGPIDDVSLRALAVAGYTIGFSVPEPPSPQLIQQMQARGVTPPPPQTEDQVLRSVFDSARSQGLSPGNASMTVALNNYRDQTAKFRALTDSNGAFAIRDVPPGRYTVRAERDGYFGAQNTVQSVDVQANQTVRVSMSMVPGATVGGTIRDDAGDTVANATVQILSVIYTNGFPVLGAAVTTRTNHRGDYRLFWLPAGDYFVGASREVYSKQGARTFYPGTADLTAATPISLKTGENRDRVDFLLKDTRMVTVSGEVTSSAPPTPAAAIPAGAQPLQQALIARELSSAMLGLLSRSTTVPDTSDNPVVATVSLNGNRAAFEFSAPPGSYDLAGVLPTGGAFGKIPLDIGDRDVRGVSLNIEPPIQIKGTLTVNGALPAGLDLARLRVTPQPDNRLMSELFGFIGTGRSTTAPDGALTFAVPAGTRVKLTLAPLTQGLYLADVLQNGTSVFDSGFDARADAAPVQVVVNTDGGTVRGSIQDPAGKPLPNGIVALVPAEARRQNRALYRSVVTDANGRFTIVSVAPGQYKLFAWGPGLPTGSFYNSAFLARYEDRGSAINVAPAAIVDAETVRVPLD
jgi:hypothetical protein